MIAAATVLLGREARDPPRVPEEAVELCEAFLADSFTGRVLRACTETLPGRGLLRLIERVTLPGIVDHYWRRKRWIEDRCRRMIATGCSRVIVFGAGFDTLGLRLARGFPSLEVTELDHPSTQGAKLSALFRHGITVPDNIRFVAADLSAGELPPELEDDKRESVCILEGLLMYLEGQAVNRLLENTRHTGHKVNVIFTFMSEWPDGDSGFRPRSRLVEWWLDQREEPFRWALPPEKVNGFLRQLGFTPGQLTRGGELREVAGERGDRLDGENLVWCEAPGTRPEPEFPRK